MLTVGLNCCFLEISVLGFFWSHLPHSRIGNISEDIAKYTVHRKAYRFYIVRDLL